MFHDYNLESYAFLLSDWASWMFHEKGTTIDHTHHHKWTSHSPTIALQGGRGWPARRYSSRPLPLQACPLKPWTLTSTWFYKQLTQAAVSATKLCSSISICHPLLKSGRTLVQSGHMDCSPKNVFNEGQGSSPGRFTLPESVGTPWTIWDPSATTALRLSAPTHSLLSAGSAESLATVAMNASNLPAHFTR